MTILLASPVVTPPPRSPRSDLLWVGTKVTWTGYDSVVWNLTDRQSPVRLGRGVQGFGAPAWKRYRSEAPAVAGSRHHGSRAGERELFLPVGIFSRQGSQAWLDVASSFLDTMHPERPGVLAVTKPNGETRTLRCRFLSDRDHADSFDPSLAGWAFYGLVLVAEQPFWEGRPIVAGPFTAGAGASFHSAPADPFVIRISSGSTLASAAIDNVGDEPAYPVWTLRGPFDSASVGVGGQSIEVPFSLADGKHLTIDTNPAALTAVDSDGVVRTGSVGEVLGAVEFSAVPAGSQVPLQLSMVGTGSVEVSLTPLYDRAR